MVGVENTLISQEADSLVSKEIVLVAQEVFLVVQEVDKEETCS